MSGYRKAQSRFETCAFGFADYTKCVVWFVSSDYSFGVSLNKRQCSEDLLIIQYELCARSYIYCSFAVAVKSAGASKRSLHNCNHAALNFGA